MCFTLVNSIQNRVSQFSNLSTSNNYCGFTIQAFVIVSVLWLEAGCFCGLFLTRVTDQQTTNIIKWFSLLPQVEGNQGLKPKVSSLKKGRRNRRVTPVDVCPEGGRAPSPTGVSSRGRHVTIVETSLEDMENTTQLVNFDHPISSGDTISDKFIGES